MPTSDQPNSPRSSAASSAVIAPLAADLGITGANFAVAETGTIVIVENEGNARLTTSLPARSLGEAIWSELSCGTTTTSVFAARLKPVSLFAFASCGTNSMDT